MEAISVLAYNSDCATRVDFGLSGKQHPFGVACMSPLEAQLWLMIGHGGQISAGKVSIRASVLPPLRFLKCSERPLRNSL